MPEQASGAKEPRWLSLSPGALWRWLALLLGLRIVYLSSYVALPFLYGPVFDAQVYLAQADAVRAGRFGDPTLLAFSPLYGYFLAALGAHPGSIAPVLVQLALGVVNVALVARIAAALFDRQSAAWAAATYAAYGPLLFFETKIMSETLGLSLLLSALDQFVSPAFRRGAAASALRFGLSLGLAVLARASLLFCVPLFVFAAFAQTVAVERTSRRTAVRQAGLFCAALLALFASYGCFTRAHSGLFVPVILVSNSASQATHGVFQGDLRMFQVSSDRAVGAWSVVEQAERRLRALRQDQPDPASARGTLANVDLSGWLRQLPSKLWLTLRDTETSFDYGFYGERSEIPALAVTFASFGMVAGAAALGALQALRAGRADALLRLAPLVFGVFALTTLFHPSTRYRLPLLVAFAPLSGFAWARGVDAYRSGRPWLLLSLCVWCAGFAVVGFTRGLSHPGMWQLRVAESAAMAGETAECRARVRAAFRLETSSPELIERARYIATLRRGCVVAPPAREGEPPR